MELSTQVRASIDESVLCWLATSSREGQPSVSPKEIFAVFKDDSIIIANIASPNSARNIKENPRACVSFVNVFTQKGYQAKGSASYIQTGDEDYEVMEEILLKLTGGVFPFKSIFRVVVDNVSQIIAPRYRFFPGTSEGDQIRSAMDTYGVQAKP